jgi:hypothetical protein
VDDPQAAPRVLTVVTEPASSEGYKVQIQGYFGVFGGFGSNTGGLKSNFRKNLEKKK